MTPRRSALSVVILLSFLIFSPTINILFAEVPFGRGISQALAGVLALSFIQRYRLTPQGRLFVTLMAVAIAASVPLTLLTSQDVVTTRKLVGVLVVALLIPPIADNYAHTLHRFVNFTLALNIIVVGLQLIGATEWVFAHIAYANADALPVNLISQTNFLGESIVVPYLPQLRPSGGFPSPTYLSLSLILFWFTIASSVESPGRLATFGVGVLCSLSGSSVGLFLAGISLCFLPLKGRLIYMTLGAAFTMWAYAVLAPWQFSYNYNLEEFMLGFSSRLDLQSGGESIIQQRPYEFAAGVLLAGVAVLFARRLNLFMLGRAAFVIFFPVLLHDVGSALIYWTLVALAVRSQTAIRFVSPALTQSGSSRTIASTTALPR